MDYFVLVIICIIGCLFTSINLGVSIYVALQRQALAYQGDTIAAKRILLPCYKPLFRGLLVFYVLVILVLSLTFIRFNEENSKTQTHRITEYFGYALLTIYSITPVMLTQTSVSSNAFWRSFFILFPWWVICSVIWALSFQNGRIGNGFSILFVILSSVPPIILSIGTLTKVIYSRIQIGSTSNRNSTELLMGYSLFYGIMYLIGELDYEYSFIIDIIIVSVTFVLNQLFPFALYRTLLADTKFWRGLGKHNQGGIDLDDELRNTGVNVHRPTMELSLVSSSLQTMMADIRNITVDFAFLKLEKYLGQGATAKVYTGSYRRRKIAIKLSTPPEITEDVIDVFVAEAKIASQLKHKNIVEFIGICVRPPQIGMVFEYCNGGDLKTHLKDNHELWTTKKRLQACLDAAMAIEHVHKFNFIHRDIKAENFFVDQISSMSSTTTTTTTSTAATTSTNNQWVIKLGDFGESTCVRNLESTKTKRMTILGTVAFMAPELVNADRYYTQSIDIYALGVTFWEIWSGKDPYDDCSQFEIYELVKAGKRLPELPDVPEGINELLQDTWLEDASLRPDAKLLVHKLRRIIQEYRDLYPEEYCDDIDTEIETYENVSGNRSSLVMALNPILNSFNHFKKQSQQNNSNIELSDIVSTARETNSNVSSISSTSPIKTIVENSHDDELETDHENVGIILEENKDILPTETLKTSSNNNTTTEHKDLQDHKEERIQHDNQNKMNHNDAEDMVTNPLQGNLH